METFLRWIGVASEPGKPGVDASRAIMAGGALLAISLALIYASGGPDWISVTVGGAGFARLVAGVVWSASNPRT